MTYSGESLQPRWGEFLRPRLRGTRFEDGSIPLEILGELAALRDMVLDVARWLLLEEHPYRQRSPRRFNRIDLKLTGIERKSAVPVLSLVPDGPSLGVMPAWYHHFYEQAREEIVNVIGAAESTDSPVPNGRFPNHCLIYFNRIGRSLRDDEWIELLTPARSEPARLTKQSRLRLLQWSLRTEVSREVIVRGVVCEADRARMTFELQPVRGAKVSGPIPGEYLETVMDAFVRYGHGERVIVRGVGRHDQYQRLFKLESVNSITTLEPLDVPARLDEFREMKDGWLEGDGEAPDHAGLDWLATNFDRYYPDDVMLPHTYPTPEGGVEMEWSLGPESVILEIDLEERHGDWLKFNKESDEEDTQTLNLSNSMVWEWIAAEIRLLSGSPE